MSFAFSQITPETQGQVTDMAVPFSDYIGAKVDEALHNTPLAEVYRWSELHQQQIDEDQPKISAEQANRTYGLPNLKFSEPVNEGTAQLMKDNAQTELDRSFLLNND